MASSPAQHVLKRLSGLWDKLNNRNNLIATLADYVAKPNEELRYGYDSNGDRYHFRASSGASTADAVWEVVKFANDTGILTYSTDVVLDSYSLVAPPESPALHLTGQELVPATAYDLAVLADSPIAYWKMDESDGATILSDRSGNALDGTYTLAKVSATALHTGSVSAHVPTGGAGATVGALALSSALSIEFWCQLPSPPYVDHQFMVVTTGSSCFIAALGSSGNLYTSIESSSNDFNTGYVLPDDAIHHVVLTWDGATDALQRVYVDGTLVGTSPATNVTTLSAISSAEIMQYFAAYNPQGPIDSMAIYDSALSASRVAAHYAEGIA